MWGLFLGQGFPDISVGKESACNAGEHGSIPGLGRSTGEGKKLPTPVFWPGELHGLYSPQGCKESDRTERVSHNNREGAFSTQKEEVKPLEASTDAFSWSMPHILDSN